MEPSGRIWIAKDAFILDTPEGREVHIIQKDGSVFVDKVAEWLIRPDGVEAKTPMEPPMIVLGHIDTCPQCDSTTLVAQDGGHLCVDCQSIVYS